MSLFFLDWVDLIGECRSQRFVGTFDLGGYISHALGLQEASIPTYKASNMGAILLAPDRRVVFKWVAVDSIGDPNLWLLPKLKVIDDFQLQPLSFLFFFLLIFSLRICLQ